MSDDLCEEGSSDNGRGNDRECDSVPDHFPFRNPFFAFFYNLLPCPSKEVLLSSPQPMFSIVIPSKNEEERIGRLLQSIKDQTTQPTEIILADKSSDTTREIARGFGITIIDGQDDGRIGRARNNGAKCVKTDITMFMDADTELPTCTFLEDALTCFDAMELDVASCYYHPTNANWKTFLIFNSINILKKLDGIIKLGITTGGGFIMVRQSKFNEVNGFNENIKVCEDIDMVWRMVRNGSRYGVLPFSILVSSRRFTRNSVPTILRTIVGGIGAVGSNVLQIPFLVQFRDSFERFYGQTGGPASLLSRITLKDEYQKEKERKK